MAIKHPIYPINRLNEPNPDSVAQAYADLRFGRIQRSASPEKMYMAVMKALEQEIKREKQAMTH